MMATLMYFKVIDFKNIHLFHVVNDLNLILFFFKWFILFAWNCTYLMWIHIYFILQGQGWLTLSNFIDVNYYLLLFNHLNTDSLLGDSGHSWLISRVREHYCLWWPTTIHGTQILVICFHSSLMFLPYLIQNHQMPS